MEDDASIVVAGSKGRGKKCQNRNSLVLGTAIGSTYPFCDNFRLYCMIHFYKETCVTFSYISCLVVQIFPRCSQQSWIHLSSLFLPRSNL